MKALGLLGVLIVLVAVGALVAYLWARHTAAKQARKDRDAPWTPVEDELNGAWVVRAVRPGHKAIVLSSQQIEDGFLDMAITQARSDAYESFMALKPRGKWDLS